MNVRALFRVPAPLDKKHNAHVIYPAPNRRISDTMNIKITTRHDIRIVDVYMHFRDGNTYVYKMQMGNVSPGLGPTADNAGQHFVVGRENKDIEKLEIRYEFDGKTVQYEHFPQLDNDDIHIKLTGRSLGEELMRNKAMEAVRKYG